MISQLNIRMYEYKTELLNVDVSDTWQSAHPGGQSDDTGHYRNQGVLD